MSRLKPESRILMTWYRYFGIELMPNNPEQRRLSEALLRLLCYQVPYLVVRDLCLGFGQCTPHVSVLLDMSERLSFLRFLFRIHHDMQLVRCSLYIKVFVLAGS